MTGGQTGGGGGQMGGGGQTDSGGGQAADTTVDVDVIGAKAARSRLGKRIVQLELNLDEAVAGTLTLVRKGTTLASKRFAKVTEGNRVLTLAVPRSVTKGKATLRVELTDTAGNTLTLTRRVKLGPLAVHARVLGAAGRPVVTSCGTIRVAGKTWKVGVKGLSCAVGKRIVRSLAPKTAPLTGYPGLYSGMKCLGFPPGGKPTRIACASETRVLGAGVVAG